MINFRLLYILLDPHSIRTFLGIMASLGFGVLFDIVLFLKLAVLVGPWITVAALAFLTALGVLITYKIVGDRRRLLVESIDQGTCEKGLFTAYLTALTAGLFLLIPGVINKVLGAIVLAPPLSVPLGDRLTRAMGIDWTEGHEYLRLNRIASPKEIHSTDS